MDLRAAQRPLKDQYSATPETARISLRARSTAMDTPLTCSIDVGRQVQLAGAHPFDLGDVEATAEILERLPSIATTWPTPA